MTQNQINYWNLQEQKQHNRETESLGRDSLAETRQHNRATESIDLGKLQETTRHNRATENLTGVDLNIKAGQLGETQRHNRASESLQASANVLTQRRDESLAKLQSSQAQLNDLNSKWRDLESQLGTTLTQTQINEINQKLENAEQQLEQATYSNSTDRMDAIWRNVNGTLNAIANAIDAFVPG